MALSESIGGVVDTILSWLAGVDPATLWWMIAGFTALETTALIGLAVPGDLVVLLAGSTAATPQRFGLVLFAAALGTYVGELGGYGLGRLAGPRLRFSRLGRMLGERRWSQAESYLAGRGAAVLIPARFVSVVHAVAPVVAGTVRMPFRRFAFWSGMGALIWAATYTTVGAAAGSAYRHYGHLGLAISVGLMALTGVVLAIRSRRRKAQEES